MPHNLDLILTLTGGLSAALIFGYITQRLGLSPIAGYLIAGIAVGPFTPGFVAHTGIAEQMAELGVILLLFGVGLHFHLKDLFAVGRVAVVGALVQIAAATSLGVVVGQLAGWNASSGLVFGLAISVASTVVLLRVLADNDQLHTRPGHVAIGWLLVEDLFTILVLVLLPILAARQEGDSASGLLLPIAMAGLKVAALVGFTLLAGKKLIPFLLGYVARTRSRELFTLTVLVLALGIAVGAAKLFGASMALGAFLAGMVVGQSSFSSRAASEALPMRDAFAVLFFVSMGMLLDPSQLLENAGLTLATLAVILVAKPLAAFAAVLVLRNPLSTAVVVAIALAQIGEFSFILATLGQQLGMLPDQAMQPLVAASIISIILNPLLFKLAGPLTRHLNKSAPAESRVGAYQISTDSRHRAVIVGYGPIGRTLAALLRENDIEPTIVELNHDTVEELTANGTNAVYGDASRAEILEAAGVRQAGSLIFAASGTADTTIHVAKDLNPRILIIARTSYIAEVDVLRGAGASSVVSAEGEIALAMVERVMRQMGASADQLDRARDRVRAELNEE
jgi:CPA2 family monovalent cation:H+ antiporter-2